MIVVHVFWKTEHFAGSMRRLLTMNASCTILKPKSLWYYLECLC